MWGPMYKGDQKSVEAFQRWVMKPCINNFTLTLWSKIMPPKPTIATTQEEGRYGHGIEDNDWET